MIFFLNFKHLLLICIYYKFRVLCVRLSSYCRGLGGPLGPLVWGLWPHTIGPQVGVSQNNTLNFFGGRAWCRGVGVGVGARGSETICDGAAEGKGNTNAIRSLEGCNINVCP